MFKLLQTRPEKLLFALSTGLLVICTVLLWSYISLQNQTEAAGEQIAYFSKMSNWSLAGDATAAAGCLHHVVKYFPSGTKQKTGSALDTIVEGQRERAQLEIIAILRFRTRDDLGQRPEPWIKKYGKPVK